MTRTKTTPSNAPPRPNRLSPAFADACAALHMSPGQLFGTVSKSEKATLYQALGTDQADATVDTGLRLLSIFELIKLPPERLGNSLTPGLAALKRITESGELAAIPDCKPDLLAKELAEAGLPSGQARKVATAGPEMLSHVVAWEQAIRKHGTKRKLVPLQIKAAKPPEGGKRFTDFTDAHRRLFAAAKTTMMGWSRKNGFNWVSVRGLLAGEFSGETGLSAEIIKKLSSEFGKQAVDAVITVARTTGADSGRRFKRKADERRRQDLQHKLDLNGISQTEFAEMHGVKHATVTSIINGRHSGKRGEARRIVELLEGLPNTRQRPQDQVEALFFDRDTSLAEWCAKNDIDPALAREAASLAPMGRKSWQQLRCRMLLSRELGLADTTRGEAGTIAGLLAMQRLSMANMAESIGASRQAVDFLMHGKITLSSKIGEEAIGYVCQACNVDRQKAIDIMAVTGARL